MRLAILAVAMAAMMAASAMPVGATGGSETFRVVTTGNAYMVGLSSFCPNTYPAPDPTNPASLGTCSILKTGLGYDGLTGAQAQVGDHLNHGFSCSVTGSATSPVGSLLPFPANMAIADSISVGFDLNNDGLIDSSYGGRLQRRSISAEVLPRVTGAVGNADIGTLVGTPQWYLDGFNAAGATPSVSGNVDGAGMTVFNEGGSDVTIACVY